MQKPKSFQIENGKIFGYNISKYGRRRKNEALMKNNNYEFARRILFDADEKQPMTLKNAQGERIDFEQIFAVERGEEIYCILRPLTCVEGLHPHAALVFSVDGKGVFRAVKERRLSNEIFAEYYSAMQRAQKKE